MKKLMHALPTKVGATLMILSTTFLLSACGGGGGGGSKRATQIPGRKTIDEIEKKKPT